MGRAHYMKSPKDKESESISVLCEELLKKRPNRKLVESLMKDQGIPFQKDPILQLGAVLESLNQSGESVKTKGHPSDETSAL